MHLASEARQFLSLFVLMLAVPVAAAGQDPATPAPDGQPASLRAGSWWSVSLGAASARLTCDLCQSARDLGPSLDVVMGTYARPELRLGVEGGLWIHDQGEVRESVYRAGVQAQLHPRPESGLHLLAGIGWSGYRVESFHYDAARLTLGVGWDLLLRGSWILGNSVTIDAASFGTLSNEATPVARDVGLSVVRLGVYVRRH
jgi:hypothetical protein